MNFSWIVKFSPIVDLHGIPLLTSSTVSRKHILFDCWSCWLCCISHVSACIRIISIHLASHFARGVFASIFIFIFFLWMHYWIKSNYNFVWRLFDGTLARRLKSNSRKSFTATHFTLHERTNWFSRPVNYVTTNRLKQYWIAISMNMHRDKKNVDCPEAGYSYPNANWAEYN